MASAYGERIASMEVEVRELKSSLNEFKAETHSEFRSQNLRLDKMDDKLDRLIAIRNKGAGIVWFISSILGSSGILAIFAVIQYFRKG